MSLFLIAFLVGGSVFLICDAIWLTAMAGVYRAMLGEILLPSFRLGPAAAFYVIYVSGIVGFAVLPALASGGGWANAALRGALLGLFAYGTYDLTNQATLKVWPLRMTLIDMAWGTVLTATTAAITAAVVARFFSEPH